MRKILVAVENEKKSEHYLGALRASGVPEEQIQVFLPQETPLEGLRETAAQAAGLLLCGGPDMEPWRYGEEPEEGIKLWLDPPLDAMDWELLSGADEGATPVWAICRGMQTFNVYRGGTLWQDIYSQIPATLGGEVLGHDIPEPLTAEAHEVEVTSKSTWLGEALDHERVQVNSRHHQAVKDHGKGIVGIAKSEDGILEAFSLDSERWWAHGVQWHPENLIDHPVQRSLWQEFLGVTEIFENGQSGQQAGQQSGRG